MTVTLLVDLNFFNGFTIFSCILQFATCEGYSHMVFSIFCVEHTFSKLYDTVLHLQLPDELESRQLRAKGQVYFCLEHQRTDHIFTLRAIVLLIESLWLFFRLLSSN